MYKKNKVDVHIYYFILRQMFRDKVRNSFPINLPNDCASIVIELMIICRLEKIPLKLEHLDYLCERWESVIDFLPQSARISYKGISIGEYEKNLVTSTFKVDLDDYIKKLNREIDLAPYFMTPYEEPVKNLDASTYAHFLVHSNSNYLPFIGKTNKRPLRL